MKKTIWIGTTCFFLLAVLSINLGSASAASLPAPMATPVSGDQVFSTKVVSTSSLMGITTTSDGPVMPKGFPMSEKQFEGDALVLSGLDYGSVNLCFPVAAVNQGWGGKVGFWDGSAWKLQETSITTPAESSLSWGCAKVYQNGTYAFLKWVVDSSLLPKPPVSVPECDYSLYGLTYDFVSGPSFGGGWVTGKISAIHMVSPNDLNGKTVKVTFISANATDSYLLNGSNGNLLIANDQMTFDSGRNDYRIPMLSTTDLQMSFYNSSVTFLFDFGSCVKTVTIGLT